MVVVEVVVVADVVVAVVVVSGEGGVGGDGGVGGEGGVGGAGVGTTGGSPNPHPDRVTETRRIAHATRPWLSLAISLRVSIEHSPHTKAAS